MSRIIGVLAEFLLGIGNRNEREMKSLGRNEDETGGPLNPDFGLSGAVLQTWENLPAARSRFRAVLLTRFRLVPHRRSRSAENASVPKGTTSVANIKPKIPPLQIIACDDFAPLGMTKLEI